MENILTQIINYLLTQSWQIAALVAVIAAVSLALRNRSAHVRYLLWLIVLAKCLAPGLYTIPLAILPQQEIREPVVTAPVEMPALSTEVVDVTPKDTLMLPPAAVAKPAAPTITERLAKVTVHQWLGFGWIVGAAVFVFVAVIKALRTNRWLKRRRRPLPVELQEEIENFFADVGLRTVPKVWLIKGVGQPFVWGLVRGGIYLPGNFSNSNNNKDRRGVLGHELSHVMRFDAAVNLLQIIAQAVYWFHPFVWWANKKIRAEREKCCDEMAIARLNALPKDYGKAIVNTLIAEHKAKHPVPSLAIAGPVKNIEDRIKTIMKSGRKFYRHPTFITVITVLVLAALAVPTAIALTRRPAKAEVNPRVAELLVAFEDQKYVNFRTDGLISMVEEIGDNEPISFLLEQLNSEDRARRCNAGLALELLGDRRGVPAVIREMQDRSYRPVTDVPPRSDGGENQEGQVIQDHYYAALVLGLIGDKRAVPALVEVTTDKAINYRAAVSLGEICDKSAIPALRTMLERNRDDPFRRLFAGYALAMLGEDEGFRVVIDTLNDRRLHWTDHRHAITSLSKLRDKRAVPHLIAALKDEHPNVKVSAARALGAIGDASALSALHEALRDNTKTEVNAPTTVSQAAQKAIEQIRAGQGPDGETWVGSGWGEPVGELASSDGTDDELEAIKQTVHDLFDAAVANDAERFVDAHHPDKRNQAQQQLDRFQQILPMTENLAFSPMIIMYDAKDAAVFSKQFELNDPRAPEPVAMGAYLTKLDGRWTVILFSFSPPTRLPEFYPSWQRKRPQTKFWVAADTPDWLRPSEGVEPKADEVIERLTALAKSFHDARAEQNTSLAEKVRALSGGMKVFEAYFPLSKEGAEKLDDWWRQKTKDNAGDKKFLAVIRNGLRVDAKGQPRQNRNQYVKWVGHKYLWGNEAQEQEAIELLYHASFDPQLAYDCVYFGLSVIRPENRTPRVLKRLAELAMADIDPGRIHWGTQGSREDILRFLRPDRDTALKVFEEKPANEQKAFSGYNEACQFLYEGGDRREAAKRFSQVAQLAPATEYGAVARELVVFLEQMAAERRPQIDLPGFDGDVSLEQLMADLIFDLRDVAVQAYTVPGKCRVLRQETIAPNSSQPNPAQRLSQLAKSDEATGSVIVQRMVQLLADRRPTRSWSGALNGEHVLRYCDVALEILADVAGARLPNETTTFDRRTERGAYLGNADEQAGKEIIVRVNAWRASRQASRAEAPADASPEVPIKWHAASGTEDIDAMVRDVLYETYDIGTAGWSPEVASARLEKLLEVMRRQPRMQKLFAIAEHGTDSQKKALLQSVKRMCNVYLNELPEFQLDPNTPWRATVVHSVGLMAYPPLLLQLEDDPSETLDIVTRMYLRMQDAYAKYWRAKRAREHIGWGTSDAGTVVAFVCHSCMSRLGSDDKFKQRATAEQLRALREYEDHYTKSARWNPADDELNVMKFAERIHSHSTRLDSGWGEAVNGLAVRLRAERVAWKAGEGPIFKIDLKSDRERQLPIGPAHNDFEVEVDGNWYSHDEKVDIRSFVDPSHVRERDGIHLFLGRQWQDDSGGRVIEDLRPGAHVVRVAYRLQSLTGEPTRVLRAVSNPMQIEILAAENVDTEPSIIGGQVLGAKGEPIGDAVVELQAFAGGDVDDMDNYQVRHATTDVNGQFVFENVKAESAQIGRFFWIDGKTSGGVPYGLLLPFQVEAGQTYKITLGGKGRRIIGRFVSASGKEGDIDWTKAWADFSLRTPHMSMIEDNNRIVRAMMKSEGGNLYKDKGVEINADGSFRIENVRAGLYQLRVSILEEPKRKGFALFREVLVDMMPNGTTEIPLNLGSLAVSHGNYAAQRDWGEAVEGLQCRLSADKITWKAGEIPTLKADVRNQGTSEFLIYRTQQLCELSIDAQWYRHKEVHAKSSPFPPGKQYNGIDITLDKRWYSKGAYEPLQLPPGKHIIHVAFVLGDARKGAIEPPPAPVRVVSNPVVIEILPAESDIGGTANTSSRMMREAPNAIPILRLEKPKYVLGETIRFWVGVKCLRDDVVISKEFWDTCFLHVTRPDGTAKKEKVGWPIDGQLYHSWTGGWGLGKERVQVGTYTLVFEFAKKRTEPVELIVEELDVIKKVKAAFNFQRSGNITKNKHVPIILTVQNDSEHVIQFPRRGVSDAYVSISVKRREPPRRADFFYPVEKLRGALKNRYNWGRAASVPPIVLQPGELFEQELSLEDAYQFWGNGNYEVAFFTTLALTVGEKNGELAAYCPIRLGVAATENFNVVAEGSSGAAVHQEERAGLKAKLYEVWRQRDRNLEAAEASGLRLLGEYNKPEEQGLIYYQLAEIYSQTPRVSPSKTMEYAQQALARPLDSGKAARLYVYWADAVNISKGRREAARICLRGLEFCLQFGLPAEKPDLPAVSRFRVNGPPEVVAEYRRRNQLEMAAWKQAKRIGELIQHRQALTSQIVQWYAREPDAFDELHELVMKYLHSEETAGQLIAAARAYRKNYKAAIPVIMRMGPDPEPDADLRWGEAVEGIQCRLRVERMAWRQGETPVLYVDVRNTAGENRWFHPNGFVLRTGRVSAGGEAVPDLESPDKLYWRMRASREASGTGELLHPGQIREGLLVLLDEQWACYDYAAALNIGGMPPPNQLQMGVGRHVVQVCTLVHKADAEGKPLPRNVLVYCSTDTVQIEILTAQSGSDFTIVGAVKETGTRLRLATGLKRSRPKKAVKPKRREFLGLDLTGVPCAGPAWELPDLFEERLPGSKCYELRDDVKTVFTSLASTVYYNLAQNVFYVEHSKMMGASHPPYYGPFEGDPYEVLGLEIFYKDLLSYSGILKTRPAIFQSVASTRLVYEVETKGLSDKQKRELLDKTVEALKKRLAAEGKVDEVTIAVKDDKIEVTIPTSDECFEKLGIDSQRKERMRSFERLWRLGKALLAYESDNEARYPDTLQQLRKRGYIKERDLEWLLRNVKYLGKGKTAAEPPNTPIAFDKALLKRSIGSFTSVLFNDGHVALRDSQHLHELSIPPFMFPEGAVSKINQFREALARSAWEKALSYCSDKVKARAREYESSEVFLRDVVPIEAVIGKPDILRHPMKGDYTRLLGGLHFSPRSGTGDAEEELWWQFRVDKGDAGWIIDFETKSIRDRLEQRKKDRLRTAEYEKERQARRKAFEWELKAVKARTRLTPLTKEFVLGERMLFRLELLNEGDVEFLYDRQQVAVNSSMTITDEKGERVPYIFFGPQQTLGWYKPIKPGESAVLFEYLDISNQYDLSRAGKYKVQFNGKGLSTAIGTGKGPFDKIGIQRTFPSNIVEIEVRAPEKHVKEKAAAEQARMVAVVRRQLDEVVDLSGLNPEMPFGDALEQIKNSAKPRLNIVVLWGDLEKNAEIDRNTPINMEPISAVRLGTALELLLKSVSAGTVELGYVVDDGLIIIATKESLPKTLETRVYDMYGGVGWPTKPREDAAISRPAVAVESRFLLVSEDFLEAVGLDGNSICNIVVPQHRFRSSSEAESKPRVIEFGREDANDAVSESGNSAIS